MKKIYVLYIILLVAEIIIAVICAPHSCDWGNGAYFYFGVFGLIDSFALPFFQKDWPVGKRIGFAFLFMIIFLILWCCWFMVFNFSIICRLF